MEGENGTIQEKEDVQVNQLGIYRKIGRRPR
jgi:hypothetical protein